MDDRLKKFIEDNREAFDSETPGPQGLKELRKKFNAGNSKRNLFTMAFLRWAAVFAGILLVSSVLYFALIKKDKPVVMVDNSTEETSEIPSPLYARQIYHFKELIELKQTELKQVEKDHPELYKQFVGDVHKLDSAYRFLKTKLTESPNQEMLLEAMIQNLQLQSDLLNQQLTIIKEIKQKSKSNEKITI